VLNRYHYLALLDLQKLLKPNELELIFALCLHIGLLEHLLLKELIAQTDSLRKAVLAKKCLRLQ
jgi:hypothetical protein